jgi:hypothetical protein
MEPAPALVEFRVHMIDGGKLRYRPESPDEGRRIVQSIKLDKIFTNPQFMIAGPFSLTGCNSWRVARLDLDMNPMPEWPMVPAGWHEVAKEDFEARRDQGVRRDVSRPPSMNQRHHAEFELVSGERVYVEIALRARTVIDQRSMVEHILLRPAILFRSDDNCITLLNPRNVARWSIYPGPSQAPADAWSAECVEETSSLILNEPDSDQEQTLEERLRNEAGAKRNNA